MFSTTAAQTIMRLTGTLRCGGKSNNAKLGAPHSYVYALGISIYTKYIYHRNGGFVLHWTKQCTVGAMQSVHGPCAKMDTLQPMLSAQNSATVAW